MAEEKRRLAPRRPFAVNEQREERVPRSRRDAAETRMPPLGCIDRRRRPTEMHNQPTNPPSSIPLPSAYCQPEELLSILSGNWKITRKFIKKKLNTKKKN